MESFLFTKILLKSRHYFTNHLEWFATNLGNLSMNIALFYGSTTCYTEIAAEKIQAELGSDIVSLFNIKDTPLAEMADHEVLILGISTWDYGEIQEDWESHWPEIADIDLEGKIVALYGMGDQIGFKMRSVCCMSKFLHKEVMS